jgi:hypothetical protein
MIRIASIGYSARKFSKNIVRFWNASKKAGDYSSRKSDCPSLLKKNANI